MNSGEVEKFLHFFTDKFEFIIICLLTDISIVIDQMVLNLVRVFCSEIQTIEKQRKVDRLDKKVWKHQTIQLKIFNFINDLK